MLCNQVQSRKVLAHALENGYAILAVNADSHSAVSDCIEAALQCDAPVIIETSLWQLEGRSYGVSDAVLGLARYIADIAVLAGASRYRQIPVILHTDHIKGPKTMDILGASIRGIPVEVAGTRLKVHPSTISLDASDFSDEENIEAISNLAAIAQEAKVAVTLEMESAVDKGVTSPEVSRKLVGSVEERYPGAIHLYAPGLGTRHGFSDEGYPEFSVAAVKENIALLKSITGRDIGLALHGSSGLSKDDLSEAAQAGVVKVNWSTESLMVRSGTAARFYTDNSEKLVRSHAEWKTTAMDNGVQSAVSVPYMEKVIERILLLRGEGQASSVASSL